MNHNLYFIEILAKALSRSDTVTALRNAFEEIVTLGLTDPYHHGFEQFQAFMKVVSAHDKKKQISIRLTEYIHEKIIDIASDWYEGSEEKQNILNLIRSHPLLQREYDRFQNEVRVLTSPMKEFEIVLCCNDKILESICLTQLPVSKTIHQVTGGVYHIRFETGRILWQGELTEQDLVWARAYPGRPVRLAADTTQRTPKPTREFILFDGEIIIQVFAGIESGRMVITINDIGEST